MNLPKIFYQATSTSYSHKYDLSRPFRHGSHVYTTDGRILVRTERSDLTFDEPDRKLPNPQTVIDQAASDGVNGTVVRLPEVQGTTLCEECRGVGTITADYLECPDCSCRHQLTLKGAPLTRDCEECDGKGSIPNMEPCQVSGSPLIYLMPFYIAMLRENGVHEVGVCDSSKPVRFFGPDFEGWLMPMDSKVVAEKARLMKAGA